MLFYCVYKLFIILRFIQHPLTHDEMLNAEGDTEMQMSAPLLIIMS